MGKKPNTEHKHLGHSNEKKKVKTYFCKLVDCSSLSSFFSSASGVKTRDGEDPARKTEFRSGRRCTDEVFISNTIIKQSLEPNST